MKVKDLIPQEYNSMTALLDRVGSMVENGEAQSIIVIVERTDGDLMGGYTKVSDVFSLLGYVHYWALRIVGFVERQDL